MTRNFFAKPLEKDHNKYYNICGKGSLAEPNLNNMAYAVDT